MRTLLAILSIALFSLTVPVMKAQNPAGETTRDRTKQSVVDCYLNEMRVTVVLADGTSVEGKITNVGNDDFTIAPRRSEPATITFASVERITWEHWKESKAGRIRRSVREIAAEANLVATVHPRHEPELNGRVAQVRELSFVLAEEKSGVERELAYRDVDRISAPGFPAGPTAAEIVKNTGLILAGVVFLPLTLFMLLIGWDGC